MAIPASHIALKMDDEAIADDHLYDMRVPIFSFGSFFSRELCLRRWLSLPWLCRNLDAFLLFWNVCLHLLLLLQHLLFESLQLVLGQGLFVLAKLIDSLALSTTPNNELDLTGLCCI
ncbi:hypothetical protein LOK49_LG06G02819 [Camellia lanceoleosa]|uniref:Uncharacterized protein n=1 Tax=Camellia lanceoleosa TaxID=1840588 RepID=A0ACC0HH35_9ERIC|nr:hypothetical protein LOK49_LG06G02819 [Camellia lanceoleosa]